MDDPDEQIPVRLVVFLALTDGASQLQTLRSLSTLLQDGALVATTLEARTPEALIAALTTPEAAA
jgi:mannitol/fructose-specific phosphotransferase system IIA component (Ntr-type)